MKKHLIPFIKMVFRMTLINLLVHAILSDDQIIFEGTKNASLACKGYVYLLDLEDIGQVR
jgi:hypothetical protein